MGNRDFSLGDLSHEQIVIMYFCLLNKRFDSQYLQAEYKDLMEEIECELVLRGLILSDKTWADKAQYLRAKVLTSLQTTGGVIL